MAIDHPGISLTAKLALVCGIVAPLVVTASRWASEANAGNGLAALVPLAGPILAAFGLLLAVIARLGQRDGMVTAALWLNGVWLAVYVLQSSS